MYNLNPLNRNVLITAPEVLFHGPTSHEADPRMIEQAIIIAEERFIKKAICFEFYEDFRTKKNVVVTNANKAVLEPLVNVGNTGLPIVLKIGDIVNAIEQVTDAWYKTLWFEFLWKICAECVVYIATPTNFSEYTSQGEMINNPKSLLEGSGAASATHKEVTWKMDKLLMDRIDPLIASMHEWICLNVDKFPLYKCKHCECKENGISTSRKSGWINAYRKNNKEKICCDD